MMRERIVISRQLVVVTLDGGRPTIGSDRLAILMKDLEEKLQRDRELNGEECGGIRADAPTFSLPHAAECFSISTPTPGSPRSSGDEVQRVLGALVAEPSGFGNLDTADYALRTAVETTRCEATTAAATGPPGKLSAFPQELPFTQVPLKRSSSKGAALRWEEATKSQAIGAIAYETSVAQARMVAKKEAALAKAALVLQACWRGIKARRSARSPARSLAAVEASPALPKAERKKRNKKEKRLKNRRDDNLLEEAAVEARLEADGQEIRNVIPVCNRRQPNDRQLLKQLSRKVADAAAALKQAKKDRDVEMVELELAEAEAAALLAAPHRHRGAEQSASEAADEHATSKGSPPAADRPPPKSKGAAGDPPCARDGDPPG